ncbi:pseudaminic acid biosynthesis-associated methylase [Halalkalibacter flavus]|uniref:pseudaminic acid biosynthesis-associated methylase n=1 Tax=Halalkalibacter flavus TaxID=3090668 RepID=UPI002FC9B161
MSFIKTITLEVGCNVGNQLRHLQSMNYGNLYGVELQWYAVQKAKSLTKEINIIQGTAYDIPFKNKYFDLVFTSGVLIHISPTDIKKTIQEMYRVSKRYIWGFEYYSDTYKEVEYRGSNKALWKGDFASLFLTEFPDLRLVKQVKVPYLENENVDSMYLLEKVQ